MSERCASSSLIRLKSQPHGSSPGEGAFIPRSRGLLDHTWLVPLRKSADTISLSCSRSTCS